MMWSRPDVRLAWSSLLRMHVRPLGLGISKVRLLSWSESEVTASQSLNSQKSEPDLVLNHFSMATHGCR